MSNHGQNANSDDGLWTVALVLFFLIGVPVLMWYMNHTKLSYWGLWFAWKQLALIDLPFMPWVAGIRAEIAGLAAHPKDVEFFELFWRMTQAGFLLGWIPIAVTVLTIRTTLRHRSEKIRRAITVKTLPRIMSAHCPAVIPVLHYGDLLNENIEGEESREHPGEFARRHKLIVNNSLDPERTTKALSENLGEKITSLTEMKIYERALFAVFASRVFDTFENNGKAQAMLDKLNYSCNTGKWKGRPGFPDFSVISSEINHYMKSAEAQELLKYFQYSSTYLHMLHLRAIKRGKLVSSNFRWLKGIDRGLWYVLNATGRKKPCIESLIQIQTYRTEHLAWESGYALIDPPYAQCIEALRVLYIKEGLLPKPFDENKQPED